MRQQASASGGLFCFQCFRVLTWYNEGMSSVFTKIVNGEIPCYKIYEDERTMAFLDIEPEAPGHTLVIPKAEVDRVYDLDNEDYAAVMATVKKLARHMEDVLGKRTLIKVIGVDVPHAHVHLIPFGGEPGKTVKMSPEEMEEVRKKLAV